MKLLISILKTTPIKSSIYLLVVINMFKKDKLSDSKYKNIKKKVEIK